MIKNEIKEIISSGNRKRYREFGLTMGAVLGLLAAYLYWNEKESAPYFLSGGLLFITSGFFIPHTLKYVYMAWMCFAVVFGYFMSRVILSLIFIVLFIPVGLITRILRKDLLKEKWDINAQSYWIKKEMKQYDPQSAEKQY
jgi:hypothetical protein